MKKKKINEISKIKGYFNKVIYTEFSPYDHYVLLSIYDNNDIKIFAVNKTMPKNHIFYEQPLDKNIKWTKNQIGVLSEDRKTIFISTQNIFKKEDIWEKKFEENIIDFHFYNDFNEENVIVITKNSVKFVEKEREDKLIYPKNDDIDINININYSFYLKNKKILIIFDDKVLIGLSVNYNNAKKIFKSQMDKNHYTLFFYNEKSLENNELCKCYNIEVDHINLLSVNLKEYDIKEINNNNNNSIIKHFNEFLKYIVKTISNIGYLISNKNNIQDGDKYIHNKKYFSYNEIEEELKKVKELDLFKRKDNVSYIFNDKDNESLDAIDLINDIKQKYIFILKLLINDNTNKNLIEKYLDFLKDIQ